MSFKYFVKFFSIYQQYKQPQVTSAWQASVLIKNFEYQIYLLCGCIIILNVWYASWIHSFEVEFKQGWRCLSDSWSVGPTLWSTLKYLNTN